MPNGWAAEEYVIPGSVIAGEVEDQVVSKEFRVSAGGALNMIVKVVADDVTVVGAISAMLQTANGSDWEDVKSVSITTDDAYYIRVNVQDADDQDFLPLLNKGRIVVTTDNAGDEVTISSVEVLQNL